MKVGKAVNEYEVGKYICMITISVDQLLMFFIVVKFFLISLNFECWLSYQYQKNQMQIKLSIFKVITIYYTWK